MTTPASLTHPPPTARQTAGPTASRAVGRSPRSHSDFHPCGKPRLSCHRLYRLGLPTGCARCAVRNRCAHCFSLTGYSGGGKKMIASYEAEDKTPDLYAPRIYGLNLQHKHLPEMQKVCGLSVPPVFCPVVDDYYKGMATTVMLPGQNEHHRMGRRSARTMPARSWSRWPRSARARPCSRPTPSQAATV